MSPNPTTIGVFPLPIFLLPQGITRLRIFEPRYKRLVSEAAQGNGFALSLFDENMPFQSSAYGTLVDIVDFSQCPDGLLTIDIKATKIIALSDFTQEHDGLRRACFVEEDHWSNHPMLQPTLHASQIRIITQTLIHAITHDAGLSTFYPAPNYDDLTWVCARFVEFLPLPDPQKQLLIYEQTFEQVQDFLHTVVTGEH